MNEEELQTPEPVDGQAILSISSDAMEAKLTILPPSHGGAAVTLEQVMAEMASAKVVYGIDQAAIRSLVERAAEGGRQNLSGVVATGRRPVDGRDGYISYHELLQAEEGVPKLREDGTVDFFDLSVVRNVKPETVLATRHAPTEGQSGCDILGRTLAGRPGRDCRLVAGAGTRLSTSGQQLLAAIEGHATCSGGSVIVSPIYTVRGDVDFGTGNIDFVGTVIIHGDVGSGFTVKAGQGVEVHGGIMGGSIEAGGDVTVRSGIVGGGRTRVVAGGRVQCRFIEGAQVVAKGEVRVADAILNAEVSSEERVQVVGGKGSIIGGLVQAQHEVSAQILGSGRGIPTEIQVGISPALKVELAEAQATLADVERRINRVSQAAVLLGGQQGRSFDTRSTDRGQQRPVLSQRLSGGERERLAARVIALQGQFAAAREGRICAQQTAYPGVRIMVGQQRYSVIDPTPRSCFFTDEDGFVTFGPL